MSGKIKCLNGLSFGLLHVTESPPIKKKGRYYWECKCECGNFKIIRGDSLLGHKTESCGCLQITEEKMAKLRKPIFANSSQPNKIGKKTKSNCSGIVGVNWDKSRNKWQASIRFQRTKYNLGRFNDIEQAKEAREKAEEKIRKYLANKKRPTAH